MKYEEFIALAKKHYNDGGDVPVNCWEKSDFELNVKMCGEMTKDRAIQLFRMYSGHMEDVMEMR